MAHGQQARFTESVTNQWVHGIIIVVRKHFGFIRHLTELPPPFLNRNIHFSYRKANWNVEVNDYVAFKLDRKQHSKPTVYTMRLIRRNVSANELSAIQSSASSSHHPLLKRKRTAPVMQEERREGKITTMKPTFGFIRHETIRPRLEILNANLYFPLRSTQTGHFGLYGGDIVSFYVHDKPKLQASDVRLVKCIDRPVEVVESYITSILEKAAESGDVIESREHVIVAAGCLPVWECIGRQTGIADNGLKMLVELLIVLHETEFTKENAAAVSETLHGSPLFSPRGGRFPCYINDLKLRGMTNELSKAHRLILLMSQSVPKYGWQIAELVKPLVSSEKGSTENFLFQLLRQFTKGSGESIENMQWNELPLVPSIDELASGKLKTYAGLQPVIEKGAYPSTEAYIDTYFRLLRADCFSSLAKGVTDLLCGELDPRDMNVYAGIRFFGIQLSHNSRSSGLCIGLAIKPDQKVNWDQSSRLMFGNLLCISVSGTFQDPIWATVVSRDLLKDRQVVVVELCSETNSGSNSKTLLALYNGGPSCVMVESPTYYRAYQPVLKALQSIDTEKIVFEDELIKCQHKGPPEYTDTEFDGSIIYPDRSPKDLNVVCYSENELSLERTNLDASQEAAVKHCLRNRVAIIQGPPGTGKTFIGVKIVQLLLSFTTPPRLPILVLTYKNHALDEFLKALLKVIQSSSVARVGGRSQERNLSYCNLNELRRSEDNRTSVSMFKEIKFRKTEMNRLERAISKAFDSVDEQRYFGIDSLLQFFSHDQLTKFLLQCRWWETNQKPFKTEDGKWQTVGYGETQARRTISRTEVTALVGMCGSFTIQNLISDRHDLGKKLYELLRSALSLWLPVEEDFHEFEQSHCTVPGRYNRTASSAVNDWTPGELDADEAIQERLAASCVKQTSAGELFEKFVTFDDSRVHDRKAHLLKIDQHIVETMGASSLTGVHDLWKLKTTERILVIQYVQQQKFTEAGKCLEPLFTEFAKTQRAMKDLEDQQKVNILQQMKVVGMTVTGANMNRNLIAQIKPEIILVEEAAEVLEPQLVSLLGDWVKHLILIGDHKQLRPAVENYMLAREYHLDLSLMERLINNGLPYATLTMQNRMRPEFAELLLDIYPNLQSNLDRVEANQPADCIGRTMYFWDHNEPETQERSFFNMAEAERAVRLALFLVDQGYQPSKITILSPYLGQVRLIRQMTKDAEKKYVDLFASRHIRTKSYKKDDVSQASASHNSISVHTVNLYQGDENDFVIVSLVRSNDRGNIGFLSVRNRRCVAQSRARCGLYFIGNRQTLSHNKGWNVLIEGLAKSQCVGTLIPLHCPSHPIQSCLDVSNHEEIPFKQRFCNVVCHFPMPCGQHTCKKICQPRHSHDNCKVVVCFTFEGCGHSGERECCQDESKLVCKAIVSFEFKQCSHSSSRKCFEKEAEIMCHEKCAKLLTCDHPCEMKCGELCNYHTCSVCRQIQEAEAEKRRIAERKQRIRIRRQAMLKIEAIKQQNPEDRVHREDLSRDGDHAEEYYSIEDKVKKYVQPGHNWFPHITRIEKLVNLKLEICWLKAKRKVEDPIRCDLKFHDNTAEAINSIVRHGFKVPHRGDQMFGPGIYFSSDSSKSAQELHTKKSNTLMLCEVILGKAKTVDKACKSMTYTKLKRERYDSLFAKRGTCGVIYDEFVVYDPRQAIPRYVVHYDRIDCTGADYIDRTLLPGGQSPMVKHHIPTPKRGRSLDALEMHFSIAESQFLRLMAKRNMQCEVQSVDFYVNTTLMQKFELKQAEMKSKYPGKDESEVILAFHGTKSANIPNIVENNFDLTRLASAAGSLYGAGIYFSEFPEVSIKYARCGALLLCKVLPGKSYNCPTYMPGQDLQTGYDSHRVMADEEGRCREIVIFDPDQILPCYVINYQ